MLSWFTKQSPSSRQDSNEWEELAPHKAKFIRNQLMNIQDSIWYSTEYGMAEYCRKTNNIINIVKYTDNISPKNHACVKHKNNVYIVDGQNGEIILFTPLTQQFKKEMSIPKIGRLPSCVVMHDEIHIFHGDADYKHLVYSIGDKITMFDDPITKDAMSNVCILKYKNKIIRFAGYNHNTAKRMDTFWISSAIQANQDNDISHIRWTMQSQYQLKQAMYGCGHVVYKQYILTFGGSINGKKKIDTIYCLDLNSNIGWIEIKDIRCPLPSQYKAILCSNDQVHLFSTVNDKNILCQYSLSISTILDDLNNNTNDENINDDSKNAECYELTQVELNDDVNTENNNEISNAVKELECKLNDATTEKDEAIQIQKELELKLEQVRAEKNKYLEENNKLKTNEASLMEIIKKIQAENMKLCEERKEAQLEINSMKEELDKLIPLKNINSKHYMEWTSNEFVDWIINIDGGKYKMYENKLRDSFVNEGVNGSAIPHIDKLELKGWGISNFMHRTNLDKKIKDLIKEHQIKKKKKNVNYNGDIDDDENGEGNDGTPYV